MRVWRSFKRKGIDGVTLATIFGLAMDKGWANIPEPEETPENIEAAKRHFIEQNALTVSNLDI